MLRQDQNGEAKQGRLLGRREFNQIMRKMATWPPRGII
jgi:hypothetical protein